MLYTAFKGNNLNFSNSFMIKWMGIILILEHMIQLCTLIQFIFMAKDGKGLISKLIQLGLADSILQKLKMVIITLHWVNKIKSLLYMKTKAMQADHQ